MFNEHRIYTFMYNWYVKLEIYTTRKQALIYFRNSTFLSYQS